VLSEGNKKQGDVTCIGMRFPGQWKHLGGLRVPPYACDFGALWLQIRATVRITDRRGQAFETITDKAMNNATNVSENQFDLEMDDRMFASLHPWLVLDRHNRLTPLYMKCSGGA